MKAYEGSFNYRREDGEPTYDPPELEKTAHMPLTIDGVEVIGVWYADTKLGIAKAYVELDGTPGVPARVVKGQELAGKACDVGAIKVAEDCYLLSKSFHGKVIIWGPDE